MEKRSWLFWVLFILSVQACCANNDKVYGPIVPNKINDRYVPARYQNIGGLLGYRMNINLEKRLLQIDSATLLSRFKKRPGSQTWIGEHVGKFLFSASKNICL